MNKETMTVHMLLAEMKTIEKRISKAMEAVVPIATKENASKNVKGIPVDEFEERAKAGEQRVIDLINRHNAMKSTLYQYNTTKEIVVAGDGLHKGIGATAGRDGHGVVGQHRELAP